MAKVLTPEQRAARLQKNRKASKKWRQEHPEKCKAYRQKYYQAHKEEHNERVKQYRKDHPEEYHAYQAKYRDEHREEINAKQRERYRRKKAEKQGVSV